MSTNPALRGMARDSLYNLIRQGWSIVMGLGISVLLARGLGTEARGIYTLVVLLPELLVTFLNLGIGAATVYIVGKGQHDLAQVVRQNTSLAIWISLASVAAGILCISIAGDRIFPDVPRIYLFASLVLVPISMITAYLSVILQGMQDFRLYNLVGMISQLLLLIFVIVFVWWLKKGIPGALVSLLAGNLGGLVLLVVILGKKFHIPNPIRLLPDPEYSRQVLAYGLKAHMSNIVTYLNYRLDNFILNLMSGAAQVGIYSVSVGLAERLWIPSNAIATVILPRIASLSGDEEARKEITPLTARFVFWLSLVMAVLTWLLADWAIVFLYGEQYRQSALALRLLLPGVVVFNLTRILANDIAGRGKPEINLYQSFAALIVNILANLILIPSLGAAGASISSTISYSVLAILILIAYCKITGVPWKEIIFLNQLDLVRITKTLRLYLTRLTDRQKRIHPDLPD